MTRPKPLSPHRPAIAELARELAEYALQTDARHGCIASAVGAELECALACGWESGSNGGSALEALRLALTISIGSRWEPEVRRLWLACSRSTIAPVGPWRAQLARSLSEGRTHAARYRRDVGPCPRWELELAELERVLSAAPPRSPVPKTA